jgi:hypothetical protein
MGVRIGIHYLHVLILSMIPSREAAYRGREYNEMRLAHPVLRLAQEADSELHIPTLRFQGISNNVLFDDDIVAHESDFGIARLVLAIGGSSQKDTSTIGIKGTVGYAPPGML